MAVAANAAGEPAAVGRARSGRELDDRRAVLLFARVVALHHLLQRDGEFQIPASGGQAASDNGLAFPGFTFPEVHTPILIGQAGEWIREPLEQTHPEPASEVMMRTEFELDVVIPDEAVERMIYHVGEAPPRLKPRAFRIDGRRVGDVDVFFVVSGIDFDLSLDGRQEEKFRLRKVIPEAGQRRRILPLAGSHRAIDLRWSLDKRDTKDGCIDSRCRPVGSRGLLGGRDHQTRENN